MPLLNADHGDKRTAAASIAINRASKISKLLESANAEGALPAVRDELRKIATQSADRLVFDVLEHIANGECLGADRHAQALANTAVVARDACRGEENLDARQDSSSRPSGRGRERQRSNRNA